MTVCTYKTQTHTGPLSSARRTHTEVFTRQTLRLPMCWKCGSMAQTGNSPRFPTHPLSLHVVNSWSLRLEPQTCKQSHGIGGLFGENFASDIRLTQEPIEYPKNRIIKAAIPTSLLDIKSLPLTVILYCGKYSTELL